ncbi:MAG: CHAT domain-containing protein, partial [Planctomycetota bacterium]
RELDALAAMAPEIEREVVRGEHATEAVLRERAGAATHLHLATHGFYGLDAQPGAIRAGVALAFANDAPGKDDGIVTVEEAALLDLRACRLVVLSACQTGLGKPFAGESLLGLRRSLRMAGARTTVTSLWRVDDAATAALMADFYRELFGAGRSPAAALRAAQLRALARARQASGEGLPGTWGAFVSEGGT